MPLFQACLMLLLGLYVVPVVVVCTTMVGAIVVCDKAAVGMMRRLEHSQKEIVLKERGKLLAWNTVRKR